jgi:hypothetical protein
VGRPELDGLWATGAGNRDNKMKCGPRESGISGPRSCGMTGASVCW